MTLHSIVFLSIGTWALYTALGGRRALLALSPAARGQSRPHLAALPATAPDPVI
jgi:hypothetical protein